MKAGVLLPYQVRWIEDESPVKVAEKSRRVGLSWAEAADNTLYAASAGGDDVFYIGYNAEMAREFINDCAFWAKHYSLAAGALEQTVFNDEDKDILAFRVNFASGHTITALSSRPRNLRGKQGRVVIDEAAFHDDFDGLLKAAMALLVWGGKVRIISTHFGDDNPFNDLVKDIRAGRKTYSLHRITFDEALADGLYKRIREVGGKQWGKEAEAAWRAEMIKNYGDDADEELHCIPSKGTGVYLPAALIEKRMASAPIFRISRQAEYAQRPDAERQADIIEWCEENLLSHLSALDKKRQHYFGLDFGRNGDLSVVWPLAEERGLTYRVPFAIEMSNIPFRQQEQILFYIIDRLPRFAHGSLDARGNGQYLAEVAMQRYGISRISQIMPSQKFYLENFPKYKAAFEDGSITVPKDADVLADHRVVRMVKGIPQISDKRTTGESGNQRHGDSAVAGLMAWHARGQETYQPVAYESAGRRHLEGSGGTPAAGRPNHDEDDYVERGYGHRAGARF
jgi:phage FluMu gp28-like protein